MRRTVTLLRSPLATATFRQRRWLHRALKPNDPVIVSAVRTPVGSFCGTLSPLHAPQLGSIVVKAAYERAGIKPEEIDEVILGNVLSAGQGQSPARQASLGAGIPVSVDCVTVNKVCASGMKSVMFAAQSISLGQNNIVVAGGMESMTNVPYYLMKARTGYRYGNDQLIDGLAYDGLTDPYDNVPMGNCGEICSKKHSFNRAVQDDYAIESFKRAAAATKNGTFKDEIVPVTIPQKKGADPVVFSEDEQYKKVNIERIAKLPTAFQKDGTITAANSSPLSDGASALIVTSYETAQRKGLKPLARILGYADAATKPLEFTEAPALAVPKALKNAGISGVDEIDLWEINEAFAVVALVNMKILGIKHEKLNVNGGAVALGHPIGSSGARILTTLVHSLKSRNAKLGVASICNGGGAASAIVVESL